MDKKEMRNLFDGDCSPAEEQAAGRWLAEHAETKEADELLYALLRETKPATANAEGAFRRVCRRLGIAPKSSAWRLVGRWTMRAAACLLLPVAALAFYLYGEAQRPGEWFEAYAPYGKTLRVVLPDGSEVVINSGSKLIYPDRFGPDRRQVFLAGEGYATIAKDPGRPFVMSAGEVDVRVLGTKFNLKSYAEDSEVEVTLVEGQRRNGDQTRRRRPHRAAPPGRAGEARQAYGIDRNLRCADGYLPPRRLRGAGSSSWTNASTRSSPTSKKRFDVKINVADRALAERRFIASFVNGESLDEMLASFNADEAMRIRREGRIVNITKR